MKREKPADRASSHTNGDLQHQAESAPKVESVLVAVLGGASFGGSFGVPGMLVGAVIGGALGYYINKYAC